MSLEMFRAYTEGYLSQRAGQLNQAEIDHLAFSARYITFEQVLRFLMDYIDGDTYYKVKYPGHNLVRTHAQYRLLQSMEEHYGECAASYGKPWTNTARHDGDTQNQGIVPTNKAAVEAAFAGVKKAAEVIDMRRHKGAHPRMGATDVLPLIPISGITLEECAALARKLAERIAAELRIPTYC